MYKNKKNAAVEENGVDKGHIQDKGRRKVEWRSAAASSPS